MEKLLNLAIGGGVAGAIYSLVATGLVVTYAATGIFNLGYGAMAFSSAYVYYELHVGFGWSIPVAAIASVLVFAPLVGLALDRLVFRRLSGAGDAAKIMAAIGVLVALPAIPRFTVQWLTNNLHWDLPTGTDVFLAPGLGPSPKHTWTTPGGIRVDSDQLIVLGLALTVCVGLWWLLRRTTWGLRIRAVVDRPALASMRGVDPARASASAWVLGSVLAGLAGVAGAPIFNSLSPGTYTSIMFVATAATVLGRFRSVPIAFAAGILLGVAQNLVTGYVGFAKEITGLGQSVPFLVLLGGLIMLGRHRGRRAGSVAEDAVAEDPRADMNPWRRRLPWAIATVLLAVWVSWIADDYWAGLAARGLALAVVFLSFVIISGLGGLVSLAQAALATASGLTAGLVMTRYGMPYLVAVLTGMLVAVVIGVCVALPALRLGGLSLALATLALGLMGDTVLFAWPWFRNDTEGWSISRPELGPVDLGDDRTFAVVMLAIVLLVAGLIHNLERSPTGRELAAVRASEVAAATSGLAPAHAKLRVFALSAAVAGLGGALLVTFDYHASGATYSTAVGLGWLAAVVLWGIRRPGAAAIAGLSASLFPALVASGWHWPGPVPTFLDWNGTSSVYVADIFFGLGAIQMAKDPDGILAFVGAQRLRKRRRELARAPGSSPLPVGQSAATVQPIAGAVTGTSDVALATIGLRAGYGDVEVLGGVDLRLAPGTLTLLIGPNGAGKSTLASTLAGLLEPSAGSIQLGGADITGVPAHVRARRGLLVLPESRGVFPGLSVQENLALWLDGDEQCEQALDRFPALRERRDLLAHDLSGGEQQMVTLAATAVRRPDVLIADEPTLGLAPLVSAEVLAGFTRLRDAGVAVLVIDEKAAATCAVADAVAILERGRIVWTGAPDELDESRLADLHLGRLSA